MLLRLTKCVWVDMMSQDFYVGIKEERNGGLEVVCVRVWRAEERRGG